MIRDGSEQQLWFRREVLPLEPMLTQYAARFCEDGQQEVSDLVHETFARLIAYPNWRSLSNVGGFSVSVLRNVALGNLRRRKIVSIDAVADFDQIDVADDHPDAERVMAGRDMFRQLVSTIEELPPQCRRVFTLQKVYGFSNPEIADKLSLSISTVEKHIVKGLRHCTQRLGETLDALDEARFTKSPTTRSQNVDRADQRGSRTVGGTPFKAMR